MATLQASAHATSTNRNLTKGAFTWKFYAFYAFKVYTNSPELHLLTSRIRLENPMSAPPFDVSKADRWFAVELNNKTWDWLEAGDYSQPNAERMVYAAHACCHHWFQVGGPENHARGECLVANSHAAVGESDSALRHARRCLELTSEHRDALADWDVAFTYDALARAHAAAGDKEATAKACSQAQEAAEEIADNGDKEFFEKWHAAGNWHGLSKLIV